MALIWTLAGFLLGAMPFSFWLGRLVSHTDIRRYGDGNPGAANAWRAGGWRAGVLAAVLDYLKGALPVALAHFLAGLSAWGLVATALAPVLGHAFSPFLRFRGGKAVTVTFGIWTGLTLWEGPTILGGCLALFSLVQSSEAYTVAFGMIALGLYLLLCKAEPYLFAVWIGNAAILAWKHRHALRQPPSLHPRIRKLPGKNP